MSMLPSTPVGIVPLGAFDAPVLGSVVPPLVGAVVAAALDALDATMLAAELGWDVAATGVPAAVVAPVDGFAVGALVAPDPPHAAKMALTERRAAVNLTVLFTCSPLSLK